MEYYLAVDIGASSGRHILGWLDNGYLKTEEVYRFDNGMTNVDGSLCFDMPYLVNEIKAGMIKCKEIGKIPKYMGIDTWAVDYVLLDKENNILGKTYGYRDSRTENMDLKVYEHINPVELYLRNGIQKQIFNTIYQLMAHKTFENELLNKAEDLFMIPDYFNFILTGEKVTEYTNGTTTQLIDIKTKNWDTELINRLDYPEKIFKKIVKPGTIIGGLTNQLEQEIGYNVTVTAPATHDTASAVLSVPYDGNGVYISSGTWSLMGVELVEPICSVESMQSNFTNEGGFDYKYRYLKNIMGLWMIQSVRNEYDKKYTFAQLCDMAEGEDFPSIVDVNDKMFLSPKSMIKALQEYCKKTNQKIPDTPGELAEVVYNSLSKSYGKAIREIEANCNITFDNIYIVGGGCNAEYLNKLTARETGKTVYAGPAEATAIGNIMAQMIGTKKIKDVTEARKIVFKSTNISKYEQEQCRKGKF